MKRSGAGEKAFTLEALKADLPQYDPSQVAPQSYAEET